MLFPNPPVSEKAKNMVVSTQHILLTDINFPSEVLEARVPVLVDCWANWCGSFQWINPVFDELQLAFDGRIKISRLNVAISEKLAAYYDIRAVPTLLLFQDGKWVERWIGSVSHQVLTRKLNALISGSHSNRSRVSCP
jgi:thioredoxin 1